MLLAYCVYFAETMARRGAKRLVFQCTLCACMMTVICNQMAWVHVCVHCMLKPMWLPDKLFYLGEGGGLGLVLVFAALFSIILGESDQEPYWSRNHAHGTCDYSLAFKILHNLRALQPCSHIYIARKLKTIERRRRCNQMCGMLLAP